MSLLSLINNEDTVIINPINTNMYYRSDDPTYIKGPNEQFRERKREIIKNLNEAKLENSLIKSIKNKNFSYSHKELTSIIINLGLNTNPLKSVLVDQLLEIKKNFNLGIY